MGGPIYKNVNRKHKIKGKSYQLLQRANDFKQTLIRKGCWNIEILISKDGTDCYVLYTERIEA